MNMSSSLNPKFCNASVLLIIASWFLASVYGTEAQIVDVFDLASKLIAHKTKYVPQYAMDLQRDVNTPYDGENLDFDNTIVMTDANQITPYEVSVST